MSIKLTILVTTLEPDLVAKEIPEVIDNLGYADVPIESFMEHPNGFGSILRDIVVSGKGPDPRWPRLSLILIELRAQLQAFGFRNEQLQNLKLTREPKKVILTLE